MILRRPGRRQWDIPATGVGARLARLVLLALGRSPIDEPPDPPVDAPDGNPAAWQLHALPALHEAGGQPGCPHQASAEFRWRRHPQLRLDPGVAAPIDPQDAERGARSAAVRGLFLARSGRFDEARASFAIGATHLSVDLTAIPGFWDLPRAGMLAAVGAYDDVERYRDASALGARIRLTYRPRSVS